MADLEALLSPVTADQPCGPDRSDDRHTIEQAFERSESVDSTGAETAKEVDWPSVIEDISGELGRTKDLWLAIYLCRAGVYARQWPVVELGAEALAGLLERYWEGVHPSLAEYGVTARVMACNSLANRAVFINPLLRVPVLAHIRLGAWSGSDLERLAKGRENEADFGAFQKLVNEGGAAQLQAAHELLGRLNASLKRTENLFNEKTGGAESPNFALTYETLGRIRKAIAQFHAPPESEEAAGPDGEGVEAAQTGGTLSKIASRADVVRAIDAISEYYRQHEPSSPVPVLLERARAWVNLPFMDVLADIAPDTLTEVRRLLLRRAQD